MDQACATKAKLSTYICHGPQKSISFWCRDFDVFDVFDVDVEILL